MFVVDKAVIFNAELLTDRVAAMSLEKRHGREKQSQKTIFNEKVRTIGIDKHALDMQIQDKKKEEHSEKEALNTYVADMFLSSKAACLLNRQQIKQKQAMAKATAQYWDHYQQPQGQLEYDLYSEVSQMMLPGLPGEDLHSEARVKRQKEQLRQWLIQQQSEQANAKHQQRLDEQHYDRSRADMDSKALQLHVNETERRRAATVATKDYNLAKSAKNEERHCQERAHNAGDNRADIVNHLQGLSVGEDGNPTLGMLGVPSVWPSSDKRAPAESLQQVTQLQIGQIEEKKRIELQKKHEEDRHDRLRLDSARTSLLLEKQQARLNKQLRRDLDNDNVKLAEAQKQQKQVHEKGSIDDSFFSKFSASCR
ncbi:RIB43A-like with coiled-coils protein 2 isoform X1 [Genypterus blacodes]|uniref:RIB43A-like with coiled-coils protein 2 isoform X1 n=1 Tax=Genypterus blacodes TaxID=154954 RepID=UPI003F7708F4